MGRFETDLDSTAAIATDPELENEPEAALEDAVEETSNGVEIVMFFLQQGGTKFWKLGSSPL